MARHLRYLLPLAVFGLLVAFLYRGLSLDPKLVPSPLIDKPAPDFSLPTLRHPQTSLSAADLKGRVWLLNVWATWCSACRAEHEALLHLTRSGKAPLYGLNYKDSRADAIGWLRRAGDPYVTNAFDETGRVGIDWGVYGAPETFLIDRQGIIRYKHIGPLSRDVIENEIFPLIARLEAGDR